MRASPFVLLAACLGCVTCGPVFGQGNWELIGPAIGSLPEAIFVSENAIYLGLAEEDGTGLGLYRYPFDTATWELFGFEGYRILGIMVWGESDENILLIRFDELEYHSDLLRSTDDGGTWTVTCERDWLIYGLSQAPSDTSHVLTHFPPLYSTDGGWSWRVPGGGQPGSGPSHARFDPRNALVAYLTAQSPHGFPTIYKSTDGGAYWSWSCEPCVFGTIDVERDQTNHVMTGGPYTSTDAGENWSGLLAPFVPKAVLSPSWSPRTFFGAGSDRGETRYEVWRTEDFADTWFPCGEGLPDLPGTLWSSRVFLEGHPTGSVLYVALEGSGVWRWDVATAATPEGAGGSDLQLLVYPVPALERFTYGVNLSRAEHVVFGLYDGGGGS